MSWVRVVATENPNMSRCEFFEQYERVGSSAILPLGVYTSQVEAFGFLTPFFMNNISASAVSFQSPNLCGSFPRSPFPFFLFKSLNLPKHVIHFKLLIHRYYYCYFQPLIFLLNSLLHTLSTCVNLINLLRFICFN